MAINTSHPGQNIHQSSTRRGVSIKSPAPMETADHAAPPHDRAAGAGIKAPASPGATMNGTTTHSPTPLVQELLSSGGAGQLPELLTLAEVCAFLKVRPSYIYSLTSTDRIPYRKFGGTLRFVKAELLVWLDRGRGGPR